MFKKIIKHIRKNHYAYGILAICLISLILFFPSLSTFYTNDDFFHLRISQVSTLKEFINFFNIVSSPEGWGLYRPLTTQVFYFLTIKFFNLNPLPLHIISFITFFAIIFLVSELSTIVTKNKKIALISAFLYATSATHFGHLYFLGAYQELGMTLFFLLSVISFVKFELNNSRKHFVFSVLFFLLSLMSKETAVILPFILVLIHFFLRFSKEKMNNLKQFIISIIPFFVLLFIYLFMRFRYYGFVQGDSYLWNFSIKRALNTLVWYKLWSLNIPEMLVDFVGPGLKLNQNLFRYWGKEFTLIFCLFVIQILILFLLILNKPVLFLPVHKFTYYLTLPIIGVVICVSSFLISSKYKKLTYIFLFIWIGNSYINLKLTENTNWITQGAKTSKNVFEYFTKNREKYTNKVVYFYDTEEDKNLPWSPTDVLNVSLSNNNFFLVFFPSVSKNKQSGYSGLEKIQSRLFLGY